MRGINRKDGVNIKKYFRYIEIAQLIWSVWKNSRTLSNWPDQDMQIINKFYFVLGRWMVVKIWKKMVQYNKNGTGQKVAAHTCSIRSSVSCEYELHLSLCAPTDHPLWGRYHLFSIFSYYFFMKMNSSRCFI
jgi:hypothetical protein